MQRKRVSTPPNRIGELRRKKGLSMAALAKQAGTTAATIDRLEKSKIKLSLGWMDRLAGPLGVRPSDLVPWLQAPSPEPSGELRRSQEELRVDFNSLRRATGDALRVLAAAMKRAPEAGLVPDILASLTWHSLQGFPLGEASVLPTTAFLWRSCGQEEKAKEVLRQIEEKQKILKELAEVMEGLEATLPAEVREKIEARARPCPLIFAGFPTPDRAEAFVAAVSAHYGRKAKVFDSREAMDEDHETDWFPVELEAPIVAVPRDGPYQEEFAIKTLVEQFGGTFVGFSF